MADRTAGVVVVGAGAAGSACARELRDAGFEGSVLLVGRDPDPPYDRTTASKGYLRGQAGRDDVLLGAWGDVELATRVSATKLDTVAREVGLSSGERIAYELGLVLCSGANVRRLRVEGATLAGIHYLRTLANADAIRADAQGAERAVLVGGSFIACEVALALSALDVACTLVMLEEQPLSDAFGTRVGAWVAEHLRAHGIDVARADALERFEGAERVERVVTASGRVLEADLVVMGTGAVPDVLLARAGGLALGETGGVACDARLRTSADGVWAAGDVCEYDSLLHGRRLRIEHWEVALAQGRCAARNVLGAGVAFEEVPYFWTDLGERTLEYVGPAARWDREIVRGALGEGSFSVFYADAERLVAALTCGRGEDLDEARALLRAGGGAPAA